MPFLAAFPGISYICLFDNISILPAQANKGRMCLGQPKVPLRNITHAHAAKLDIKPIALLENLQHSARCYHTRLLKSRKTNKRETH